MNRLRHYHYLLSTLEPLEPIGSIPPISKGELLERVIGSNGPAETVKMLLLSDDLIQYEALLAGEIKPDKTDFAVLSLNKAENEPVLPDFLLRRIDQNFVKEVVHLGPHRGDGPEGGPVFATGTVIFSILPNAHESGVQLRFFLFYQQLGCHFPASGETGLAEDVLDSFEAGRQRLEVLRWPDFPNRFQSIGQIDEVTSRSRGKQ